MSRNAARPAIAADELSSGEVLVGEVLVTFPAQPRFFACGEGRTYQLGRLTVTFKTSAEDTAGSYTLCETFEPAGWSAALHRHPSYDETHEAATALSQDPGAPGFGPATDFRAIAAKYGIEFLA